MKPPSTHVLRLLRYSSMETSGMCMLQFGPKDMKAYDSKWLVRSGTFIKLPLFSTDLINDLKGHLSNS